MSASRFPHSRERLLAIGWSNAELDELLGFSEELREVAIATRKPGADPVRSLRAAVRTSTDARRGDFSRRSNATTIQPAETPRWAFNLEALFQSRRP